MKDKPTQTERSSVEEQVMELVQEVETKAENVVEIVEEEAKKREAQARKKVVALWDVAHKSWLISLGAVAWAYETASEFSADLREQAQARWDALQSEGQTFADELLARGDRLEQQQMEKATELSKKVAHQLDQSADALRERLNFVRKEENHPSSEAIVSLTQKIEEASQTIKGK